MWLSNKRPHDLNYSVKAKWPKSWNKIQNTIKQYKVLEKRVKVEWETKWLKNAKEFVVKKLKKYSININKI
jgi:hypothetical protein